MTKDSSFPTFKQYVARFHSGSDAVGCKTQDLYILYLQAIIRKAEASIKAKSSSEDVLKVLQAGLEPVSYGEFIGRPMRLPAEGQTLVAQLRSLLGSTQEEMATLIGTSRSSISAFELGTRPIPAPIKQKCISLLRQHRGDPEAEALLGVSKSNVEVGALSVPGVK